MSIQPFDTYKMADDFLNVYLHTSNSINNSTKEPIQVLPVTGQMGDRYKFYKKCIGVVNFVCLPTSTAGATAGAKYLIRDISNTQSNSADTLIQQSYIIYNFQADTNTSSSQVGFPYLVVNPFGQQQLQITEYDGTAPATGTNEIDTDWSIHITYYFYY